MQVEPSISTQGSGSWRGEQGPQPNPPMFRSMAQPHLAGGEDIREQERDERCDQGLPLLHCARQPLRRARGLPGLEILSAGREHSKCPLLLTGQASTETGEGFAGGISQCWCRGQQPSSRLRHRAAPRAAPSSMQGESTTDTWRPHARLRPILHLFRAAQSLDQLESCHC